MMPKRRSRTTRVSPWWWWWCWPPWPVSTAAAPRISHTAHSLSLTLSLSYTRTLFYHTSSERCVAVNAAPGHEGTNEQYFALSHTHTIPKHTHARALVYLVHHCCACSRKGQHLRGGARMRGRDLHNTVGCHNCTH